MRVNVKETNKFGPLCSNCKNHQGVMIENRPAIYCREHGEWLKGTVTECDAFRQVGTMSLFEMKQIATYIDLHDGKIGFVKPGTKRHHNMKSNVMKQPYYPGDEE